MILVSHSSTEERRRLEEERAARPQGSMRRVFEPIFLTSIASFTGEKLEEIEATEGGNPLDDDKVVLNHCAAMGGMKHRRSDKNARFRKRDKTAQRNASRKYLRTQPRFVYPEHLKKFDFVEPVVSRHWNEMSWDYEARKSLEHYESFKVQYKAFLAEREWNRKPVYDSSPFKQSCWKDQKIVAQHQKNRRSNAARIDLIPLAGY